MIAELAEPAVLDRAEALHYTESMISA